MTVGSVAVATFRLRTAAQDTTALRLRAARELQAADLTPASLPPSAVLVVRRVADPMPGRFGGGQARPRLEWERAVRDVLSDAGRTAARPDARGRVPATAEALLFADEAEVIACVLGELMRGEAAGRWWCRSVRSRLGPRFVAVDGSRDPAPILCERAREAPAVLTLLTRWGEARTVAGVVSAGGASAILRAVARAHELPARLLRSWLPAAGDQDDLVVREEASPSRRASDRSRRSRASGVSEARAPWLSWLPGELDEDRVALEVRCLFGVALGLHAAPGRLRSAAVAAPSRPAPATAPAPPVDGSPREVASKPPSHAAEAMAGARETGAFDPPVGGGAAPVESTVGREAAGREIATNTKGDAQAAAAPGTDGAARHDDAPPSVDRPSAGAQRESTDATRAMRVAAPHPPSHPAGTTHPVGERRTRDREPGTAVRLESSSDVAAPSIENASQALPGEGVSTRLGGVLYLIHALDDLGLPDACEPAWGLPAAAGPWGTLDLVGRALLGSRYLSLAADPIWPALSRLAAWPSPRRHGHGPDPRYRVPAEWLARLDDPGDRFTWTLAGGRVWIWSKGGYLVAHRACRGDAPAAARRELARVLPAGTAPPRLTRGAASARPWMPPPALPVGCPARLGRLAAAMAPAIRRRLLLALGADPARRSPPRHDPIARFLMTAGQLHVSSSHVDLVVHRDRADLALRRAGLDRDPGWLPSYGRVVYFHFT
jgi:hypothetical protein